MSSAAVTAGPYEHNAQDPVVTHSNALRALTLAAPPGVRRDVNVTRSSLIEEEASGLDRMADDDRGMGRESSSGDPSASQRAVSGGTESFPALAGGQGHTLGTKVEDAQQRLGAAASANYTTGLLRRPSWLQSAAARAAPRRANSTRGRVDSVQTDAPVVKEVSPMTSPERPTKSFRRPTSWMPAISRAGSSPECSAGPQPRIRPQPSPSAASDDNNRSSSDPSLNISVTQKVSRLTGIFGYATTAPEATAPEASLARSFSMDKLPALKGSVPSLDRLSSLPSNKALDKLKPSRTNSPTRRDELWSVFKSLDSDFTKYDGPSIFEDRC